MYECLDRSLEEAKYITRTFVCIWRELKSYGMIVKIEGQVLFCPSLLLSISSTFV